MNRPTVDEPAAAGTAQHRHRARGGRLIRTTALGALSCAVGAAGLMLPADAAVIPGHTLFVLKNDSIVEAEGFTDNTSEVLVQVKRNGVVVGSARAVPSGGAIAINHDSCWEDFTPQILAGDVVEVTSSAGIDSVNVADIEITQDPTVAVSGSGVGTIRGHIEATPLPPRGQLQAELRSGGFRTLAPDVDEDTGVTGTIAYDDPVSAPGDFTATFRGMDAAEEDAFRAGGEFLVAQGPSVDELTIATRGNPVPGPGCGQDAPVARHAVTNVSSPVINRANQGSDLTVSGMTVGASAVSVNLRDSNGTTVTRPADVTGTTGPQTWTVTFPAADVARLDGTITATGTYTIDGTELNGTTMTVLKDTVAPARPSASPDAGAYRRRQAVSLSAGAGEQIRYTLGNGTQPAPTATTGSLYRGRQIAITASQTLKAVAVDQADNVSPVTRQRYRIGTVPSQPRIRRASPGRAGGRATAVARWQPPLANGARVSGYRVTALKLRRNGSVAARRHSAVVRPGARSLQMRLSRGRYRFRVRAVNGIGNGPLSARSNAVRSR